MAAVMPVKAGVTELTGSDLALCRSIKPIELFRANSLQAAMSEENVDFGTEKAGASLFISSKSLEGLRPSVPADSLVKTFELNNRSDSLLIGLTIFRARRGKKRFKPTNDSDPWQIIFGNSSMICSVGSFK